VKKFEYIEKLFYICRKILQKPSEGDWGIMIKTIKKDNVEIFSPRKKDKPYINYLSEVLTPTLSAATEKSFPTSLAKV